MRPRKSLIVAAAEYVRDICVLIVITFSTAFILATLLSVRF